MPGLVWADPIERVRSGRKRHLYSKADGSYLRDCNTSDGFDAGSIAKDRDQLARIDLDDYITDPNTCHRCLSTNDLLDYAQRHQPGGRAEDVSYDPFGVFGGGADE